MLYLIYPGKLLSVGKAAGTNSFFIPVTFEFDNRGDIIPGFIRRNIPALLSHGECTEPSGIGLNERNG